MSAFVQPVNFGFGLKSNSNTDVLSKDAGKLVNSENIKEKTMVVKVHLSHLEILQISEKEKEHLSGFECFALLYDTDGICKLFGTRGELYTALLIISQLFSVEILSQ